MISDPPHKLSKDKVFSPVQLCGLMCSTYLDPKSQQGWVPPSSAQSWSVLSSRAKPGLSSRHCDPEGPRHVILPGRVPRLMVFHWHCLRVAEEMGLGTLRCIQSWCKKCFSPRWYTILPSVVFKHGKVSRMSHSWLIFKRGGRGFGKTWVELSTCHQKGDPGGQVTGDSVWAEMQLQAPGSSPEAER